MSFSERLAILQKERRLAKKDVYQGVGLTKTAYYFYETGKREPSASSLTKLADFFNVSIDYLVGRSNNPARLP